jgi:hypothetical protein
MESRIKNIYTLPESAKVWVFPSNKLLTEEIKDKVRHRLLSFIDTWLSHSDKVTGGFDILHDKFILVAATVINSTSKSESTPSGCAIDKLFAEITKISDELLLEISNNGNIFFIDSNANNSQVKELTRDEFQDYVNNNLISENTLVFNTSVNTLSDIINNRFMIPFHTSWHKEAFDSKH